MEHLQKDVFLDIGYIDSKLFLYGEDLDFSLRAWKMGWISAVNNNLVIYHKVSSTSGKESPLKLYYMNRNLYYIINKHKDIQNNNIYFILRYFIDFIKQIIKIIIKFESLIIKINKLIDTLIAFFHGVIIKKMYKFY